jgi:hypothetical protein
MGGYTTAFSGQRLGEHVAAAADRNATVEELCFICGPCRDIISKVQVQAGVSSVRQSVKGGLFFYLVGWDLTPLAPLAGPLGSYKPQHCGHILAYCTFSPDDI